MVNVIIWLPAAALVGIVTDTLNELEIVGASRGAWSKSKVIWVSFGNPLPIIVIVEPGGPLIGFTVILGMALTRLIPPTTNKPAKRSNIFNTNEFPSFELLARINISLEFLDVSSNLETCNTCRILLVIVNFWPICGSDMTIPLFITHQRL